MLILILVDGQYSQKAVFSFEKCSNGQNHSCLGSHPTLQILHIVSCPNSYTDIIIMHIDFFEISTKQTLKS